MTNHRFSPSTVLMLLAGPVVTLAGMAATPWESESTTAAYQAALAAHETQAQIAAVLLVFGYALLGLTAFTVLRLTRGIANRILWGATATLTFFGATILPGMVFVDFYDLALAQELPSGDAVRVADAAGDFAIGAIARVPGIAGFMLGTILLAFVAWRGRLVGAWMPALVVIGFVGGMVAGFPAAIIGSSAALVVAYAGLVVVNQRDRSVSEPEVVLA
jgi:hypothetical protein